MALNKTTQNAIDDSAITTEKIEDGAVTAGKLAAGDLSISKTLLLNAAPTISSLDTSIVLPSSGATITITGTGFVSIPDVRFLNTSTGVRIQASTIGFTSSTTITAAFPSGQTVGTYKVLVENPDGKGVISTSTISYSAAPVWSTAANLGSIEEGDSVNIQLLAYDDDSTAVSSYSLVAGSLPSGVTLSGDSSVGSLTGTAPAVDADTNYTFTIRATDDESQTSDREFTLTVTNWTVANSLRFDDGSSDYLNRTPSGAGNLRTMTFSFWMKRCNFTTDAQRVFSIFNNSGADQFWLRMSDGGNDYLDFFSQTSSSQTLRLVTNARLRDPSAWYHIVVAVDTTQATDTNRIKIYINGTQQTSFSTTSYPSQNTDLEWNKAIANIIGAQQSSGSSEFIDMYLAEVCFIDGTALDPTSFGETDTASGIWKPKKISGLTFGTNGFYLPFTNSASLGADSSGNSNDFTVNNLTAIDQTTDTPTNNYATLNPLAANSTTLTLSEGNLKATFPNAGAGGIATSTFGVSSGKWYWEILILGNDGVTQPKLGIVPVETFTNTPSSIDAAIYGYTYGRNGNKSILGSVSSYGATFTNNDIISFALDMDAGTLVAYKNGVSQGTLATSISGTMTPAFTAYNGYVESANFGNPPFTISSGNADANGYGNFEYAVPSGYFALNTKNLAEYG